MGRVARRERERGEVRAKILTAARQLLSERGFDGLTMRGIAERIEYSPTVIYSHFKDKQALLSELVDADYRAVGERLQALRRIPDPLHRLRVIGQRFAEHALANPNHYRAIVMTPAPESGISRVARDRDIRQDGYALVLDTVQEAIDAGLLLPEHDDAQVVAQTFIAAVHGLVSLQLTLGGDACIHWRAFAERCALMLDALLLGLTGEPPGRATPAIDANPSTREIQN